MTKCLQYGLKLVGIGTCCLSLAGCPQPGASVDDAAGSGLPGPDNNGNAGAGTDSGSGGGESTGGGSNPLDRSVIVRPDSPTLFVVDIDHGVASFANAHVLNSTPPTPGTPKTTTK